MVMRTFVFCAALVVALHVGSLFAGTISSPALAKMGLAGVQRLSDADGRCCAEESPACSSRRMAAPFRLSLRTRTRNNTIFCRRVVLLTEHSRRSRYQSVAELAGGDDR